MTSNSSGISPSVVTVSVLLLLGAPILAAGAAEPSLQASGQRSMWDVLIALFVFAVTAASAALPLAAWREWRGYWRPGALFPLLFLLFWLGVIGLSKWRDPESHSLWPFEIFAWAMLNMIYMVGLMTAKRIIDKSDKERSVTIEPD